MAARVKSIDGRNLRVCISVDEEVDWVVHVPKRLSRIQESEAARGKFSGNNYGAQRRVAGLRVTGFLDFGCERSWSMSVVLVSSGKAWICANLIS